MLASDTLPPRTVSSRGMMKMLRRLETNLSDHYFFKILPASDLKDHRIFRETTSTSFTSTTARESKKDWSWLPKSARNSATGLAFLYIKTTTSDFQPRLAIAPPFPIQSEVKTTDRKTLMRFIDPPFHVGIILIRYGYLAIAIAHDETIATTKTATRWVPSKHRAGGQSANRFKRSREKWAREFFNKAANLFVEHLTAYPHHIDYLIFGGDQHVINQFLERANLPHNLSSRILYRRLNTLRPNRRALNDAVRQAWSSTIYELND